MAISTGSKAQMNVTPLIDVLLVLLIIFMVITPMMPQGEPAVVPQRPDQPAPRQASEDAIVLALAADGSVRINHEAIVRRDALADRLREIFARRANRVLFLDAHPDTEYELVAQVVDEAKLIAKVALMPRSN